MRSHASSRSLTGALVLSVAASFNATAFAVETGEKFGDWIAGCETPAGTDQERCYISQQLVTKKDETQLPVLHVLVGYITTDGRPGLFATVPLGASLPQGVQMRIDGGETIRFGYSHCHIQGCLGALALSDDVLSRMKAGKQAVFTFYGGRQQPVSVNVSLKGFTAGFNALP